jgi:aldose 1-epimerase
MKTRTRSGGIRLAAATFSMTLGTSAVSAAEAHQEIFGELHGVPVQAVVLTNGAGTKVRIVAYGAAVQELDVGDRDGRSADVVLSYPDMTGFLEKPQYFGATVGRYANRIAKASFSLDGHRYDLPKNNGENSLHGGTRGFDKVLWTVSAVTSGTEASATFTYVSPDGDQGFPGELTASVIYALNDRNELITRYRATTTKPTIVNLTHHGYFNLAGASSGRDVMGHRLTIVADRYAPTDAELIPTGELRPVAGTAFDFRTPHLVGERVHDGRESQLVMARGYDHNFVLNGGTTASPRLVARLEDPVSGRVMELSTTEPGLQFYSGNFLDATSAGKDGFVYRQGDALCLEPQRFPDTPNQPAFGSARLDPGQVYRHVSIYRFTSAPR